MHKILPELLVHDTKNPDTTIAFKQDKVTYSIECQVVVNPKSMQIHNMCFDFDTLEVARERQQYYQNKYGKTSVSGIKLNVEYKEQQ